MGLLMLEGRLMETLVSWKWNILLLNAINNLVPQDTVCVNLVSA